MVRDLAGTSYLGINTTNPTNTKAIEMNTQTKYATATQAEAEEIIARARQMRSAYMARSIKAGLANLNRAFARKRPAADAAA
ncbi:hypothetical protein ILP92_17385 [Maribius pontilimi]|uniref:Uncharacterized protein n=1 Tax=Palleronia pontilimi TaxID=1964209 RepID=A0A934IHL4_9RHOB|nr:hypothetical protein [Palleronia pontilimi]MBJ3764512.1 hypothetical protein [Palleronia pontilimi]